MNKEQLPLELIDTFHKALDMLGQFAKEHGVTIMGTAVMMKRLDGGQFGGYRVKNFNYNHPVNNP